MIVAIMKTTFTRTIMILTPLLFPVFSLQASDVPSDDTLPRYVCPWTDAKIVVDGIPDEPVWNTAPMVTFLDATNRSPVRLGTEARILYTDEAIYFSYYCEDNLITSKMTKRDDNIFNEEVVEVFFSPTGELSTYYEFEVNPLGTLLDLTVKNNFKIVETASGRTVDYSPGCDTDFAWNCKGIQWAVWQHKEDDKLVGWSVELAIPFAGIERQIPASGEIWRINLYRIDRNESDPKLDEYSAWSPTMQNPASFHCPHFFGFLEFAAKAEPAK
ncbi:MAG TPA: carbohydrate-binding family 9-like protein [bacterium]|mgnify:FL=1|nr:carbohydrate-binding family 9-like protein [bacterium]